MTIYVIKVRIALSLDNGQVHLPYQFYPKLAPNPHVRLVSTSSEQIINFPDRESQPFPLKHQKIDLVCLVHILSHIEHLLVKDRKRHLLWICGAKPNIAR